MSKSDDPVVGEVLGMIGDRPCEIVLFLKALKLGVIQMDRIAQQLHLAVTEELLAVRVFFQRAGHDSPAAEGQHLLGNIPRPLGAQLGIADEYDAVGLTAVGVNSGVYLYRTIPEATGALGRKIAEK